MLEREIAIEARGLAKDFGMSTVFRQVDLTVPAGVCAALTGENGSGKTTLLRCLAGLVRPTDGEVFWHGEPVRDATRRVDWIGMVAHESRLYPQLTLVENLVFAARMYGLPRPKVAARSQLDDLGLAKYAHFRPPEISRGMRQRMSIARALIHHPRILLLDEPFAGLDTSGSKWLTEVLLGLRDDGRTIFFTSHDPAITAQLASVVWELHNGTLRQGDPPLDSGRPLRFPIAEAA